MASYSGFIRKAPAQALRRFFEARGISAPADFDWSSEGRGTALVGSIDNLLEHTPDKRRDAVKAELDLLASLSDGNGMLSAEQICAGQGIDIEGAEGVQDVLLTLAIDHPKAFDRVVAQASLLRRTGGRNWSAFQFDDDGKPWSLDADEARDAFLNEAIEILGLPAYRKREADWYTTIRLHPVTGEETEITRATIYVEERAESELAFGSSETLERQIVQKVVEVGLACNAKERVIEICARGGKGVRDAYAKSFARHFAPHADVPVEVPRREVLLDSLIAAPRFKTEPADGIDRVELSALDLFSTGGGFCRVERRGDDETLHQFLTRRFGDFSPLNASGWTIIGATIRIVVAPRDDQRRRTLTVTLRTPNTTTLPNQTEADRRFVFGLLERWKLVAPSPEDDGVIEPA